MRKCYINNYMYIEKYLDKNGKISSVKLTKLSEEEKQEIIDKTNFLNIHNPTIGLRVRFLKDDIITLKYCKCGKPSSINIKKPGLFNETCGNQKCVVHKSGFKCKRKNVDISKVTLKSVKKWIKENEDIFIERQKGAPRAPEYLWLCKNKGKLKVSEFGYSLFRKNPGCEKCGSKNLPFISYISGWKSICGGCGLKVSRKNRELNKLQEIKKLNPTFNFLTTHGINNDYHEIICPKGHQFKQWLRNGKNVCRCNICHPSNKSRYEKELKIFLESLGIRIIQSYKLKNTKNKSSCKEIDIYLPDYNLGIEINGLFWHKNNDEKHLIKHNKAKEIGIELLQFTDNEINEKKEIYHSIIKGRIGLHERIFARKCKIKEIDNSQYREFCEANHIDGYASGSLRKGLVYKNKLVMVMSFGKSRFNKKYDYELVRLCSLLNHSVIGGASKLFKSFSLNNIISYSKIDKFSGTVYEKLGFKYVGDTPPGYFWFKGFKIISRYQSQKHKLNNFLENYNPNMSESKNMWNNGYNKYYNSGNNIWNYIK